MYLLGVSSAPRCSAIDIEPRNYITRDDRATRETRVIDTGETKKKKKEKQRLAGIIEDGSARGSGSKRRYRVCTCKVVGDQPSFHRVASHRIASHRIASHRIASHRIASHRIASHRIASHRRRERRGIMQDIGIQPWQ